MDLGERSFCVFGVHLLYIPFLILSSQITNSLGQELFLTLTLEQYNEISVLLWAAKSAAVMQIKYMYVHMQVYLIFSLSIGNISLFCI